MRIICSTVLLSLLMACAHDNNAAGIIPIEKMETVLWQLMQADEYVNTQLGRDSTKKPSVEKTKIYQRVYELNHISKEEFSKSYQYYMSHPDITKNMFDSITTRASRQRADMYKIKTDSLPATPVKNIPRADTLKKGLQIPAHPFDSSKLKNAMIKKNLPQKPLTKDSAKLKRRKPKLSFLRKGIKE